MKKGLKYKQVVQQVYDWKLELGSEDVWDIDSARVSSKKRGLDLVKEGEG